MEHVARVMLGTMRPCVGSPATTGAIFELAPAPAGLDKRSMATTDRPYRYGLSGIYTDSGREASSDQIVFVDVRNVQIELMPDERICGHRFQRVARPESCWLSGSVLGAGDELAVAGFTNVATAPACGRLAGRNGHEHPHLLVSYPKTWW